MKYKDTEDFIEKHRTKGIWKVTIANRKCIAGMAGKLANMDEACIIALERDNPFGGRLPNEEFPALILAILPSDKRKTDKEDLANANLIALGCNLYAALKNNPRSFCEGILSELDEQENENKTQEKTTMTTEESNSKQSVSIVYHRADYDGQFSGAICALFTRPKIEDVIGWDFGDPLIPFPKTDVVYLVDLPPDCFESLPPDVNSRLIWIDHHKSSITKWDEQLGNPFQGYRIDGVAACRLCWQWFTSGTKRDLPTYKDYFDRRVREPLYVRLAGEYDVWDKRDYRAEAFQYGLTLDYANWPEQPYKFVRLLRDGGEVAKAISDTATEELVQAGLQAQRWHHAFAKQVCEERSYKIDWEGLRFCVLSGVHVRNSLWFQGVPDDCDALMAWRYSGGGNVSFSLYHKKGREDIDLSVIAVKYGGGGHKGACGFQLPLAEAMEIVQ